MLSPKNYGVCRGKRPGSGASGCLTSILPSGIRRLDQELVVQSPLLCPSAYSGRRRTAPARSIKESTSLFALLRAPDFGGRRLSGAGWTAFAAGKGRFLLYVWSAAEFASPVVWPAVAHDASGDDLPQSAAPRLRCWSSYSRELMAISPTRRGGWEFRSGNLATAAHSASHQPWPTSHPYFSSRLRSCYLIASLDTARGRIGAQHRAARRR